ncbi:patatin-domain-containing protein [Cylindrobasidium torrendii FP15055 ss-10]|uniref:Lysophospholipase NTE1 n=1 Tax=Cylindrobasidium torrendii FP15055 ss-10 TaxID=1314674 RepID=A0A0D7BSJ1_9AGAR|nr:patatin-domain-containing protein [Cylindrobasidium torrendii FP15055 ss-10]
MDHPSPPEWSGPHPLVSLVSACFWVILWILSWVKALVAFVTITIPRLIYAALSYSFTLTLNFWSFAIIFVASLVALNYWIRFKYLNDYTQLKEPPLVKPDATELHPDVNTPEAPPSFHNYLDDFLQAVRVFGFLEKPVFHELARHLQTRRLIAGDSMSLEQDKNFYCVIDGNVQVFAQGDKSAEAREDLWEDEDMNGYQLLNEVGSGGTLSSLFTILGLFTEDVKMSWQDENIATPSAFSPSIFSPATTAQSRVDNDVSQFDLNEPPPPRNGRRDSVSSNGSTVQEGEVPSSSGPLPRRFTPAAPLSPIIDDDDFSVSPPPRVASLPRNGIRHLHEGVVARASEDTTLAVIPAEAFRRLTKKFPKATGHIVQVILTRFTRVTFNAAHKYLGLTSEVLRTEKAINDIACHPLPDSFYEGGGLQYLRQRFDGNKSTGDDENDYFPMQGSPTMTGTSATDSPKSSRATAVAETPVMAPAFVRVASSRSSMGHSISRNSVQAGDLMSSTRNASEFYRGGKKSIHTVLPTPRNKRGARPFDNDPDANDDFDLRAEVMSCIAKSIGLLQPPISTHDSVEASPAFQPAMMTPPGSSRNSRSGLGMITSLSLLDPTDDMSSMTGGSSLHSADEYMSGLDNEVEMLFFSAGTTLVKAGEANTGLYYVIEGFLDIYLPEEQPSGQKPPEPAFTPGIPPKKSEQKLLFTVKPGGIAGYLASLTHTASYVDITAKTDTYVGFLPSNALERILEKRPIVLLTLAKRLISLLSPLVLHIDASLDWMQVNAGQVIWRPGDISDSFYIVINGRLRSISEADDGVITILGEYGQGDTVGEVDVITSSTRRSTVHAIRDTELIRMPQTLFNAISARNPRITAQILRMIATRVRSENDGPNTQKRSQSSSEFGYNNNLKTIAVLPVSRNVPVDAFARKLQAALEGIGASTSYLNQATMSNQLGRHAFTRMGKLKAAGWLADLEQRYRSVLYVVDSPVSSSWTQTCIRQADCVMVVGMGDDPSIGEYERLLLSMKTTARKELVLLHPERYVVPGSTREWLKNRPWVHQHIHVELPGLMLPIPKVPTVPKGPDAVTALKNLKDKVQSEIRKYRGVAIDARPQRSARVNDFSRLARRICGNSVGLVLGGGGARGISHLGLIRALEERGIPIDHIGGTSIGAFIGGLYAREGDILSSSGRAKQFSSRIANVWRMLSDVTYPIIAYTTGHEFNRGLYKAFYDTHIEDMWLPFFCNTTNINTSEMSIHETGYAWRFIRASMTLVGLLPPLCDNGHMLVDGGYVDNLPVSVMFQRGARAVFACDVGSVDDNSPRNFGDHVSGWWLLVNRWNPFSSARTVPAITEIQSRLAYVSSVKTLEEAKVTPGCLYLAMPVQEYGTLQFGKFEEIEQKGYEAAQKILDDWEEDGLLPPPLISGQDTLPTGKKKGRGVRRNSI